MKLVGGRSRTRKDILPYNGSWAAHPSLHWLSVYEYTPY